MYYSDDIIEEIRSKNDIVDVISDYVKLQKKGNSYVGLCPFHNEKSPSFSVTSSKQMYYCFGCGEGGNVFSFIMKHENYTFLEAIKYLAEKAGIDLPEGEYSKENKMVKDKKMQMLDIYKVAAMFYHYMLKSNEGNIGYEYLIKRDLDDSTITKFGLGYAGKYSNDLYNTLKKKDYDDNILKDSGLFNFNEKGITDRFWNRVIFPILDVNSKVVGFGGRVMGDGKPKYLNSPETMIFDKSRNLYGLNFARTSKKNYCLVCEGYMDVIALHQAGFTNAIATLGTAFTNGHIGLIKRYFKVAILTYDSDEAGIKAALRTIPLMKEANISVKVINMKPYKDPDEFIKEKGKEEFENRISNAKDSFFFEIDIMKLKYNLETPREKSEFYSEIAFKLLEFKDELERNIYAEAVSKEYNIPLDSLMKSVNTKALTHDSDKIYEKPRKTYGTDKLKKDDGLKSAGKLLLTWLIEEEDLFSKISKYINEDDFVDPMLNKVAVLLFKQLREGKLNPGSIIDKFIGEDEQSEVAGMFNAKLGEELSQAQKEKALNDTIKMVKKSSLDSKSEKITDFNELQTIINDVKKLENLHIHL